MLTTMLVNVAVFVLLLVPGFVLGKAGNLGAQAQLAMTDVLMYVAMPALVLDKLLSIDRCSLALTDALICLLLPIPVVASCYALSLLLHRRRQDEGQRRAGRFCSIFSNCGFLGIPLCEVLFPDRPEVTLYVALFNVISTFLLLTFGVFVLSGDRHHISVRRALISPAMVAIVLGFVLSLTGISTAVPQIGTYVSYLSVLTTPLSMLILGAKLSAMPLPKLFKTWALYPTALLKLLLMPLIGVAIVRLLTICGLAVDEGARMAVFVSTAVSTAASAPAMAQKYGADGDHAAVLTLGTTILCVLTLPLLYSALHWLSVI